MKKDEAREEADAGEGGRAKAEEAKAPEPSGWESRRPRLEALYPLAALAALMLAYLSLTNVFGRCPCWAGCRPLAVTGFTEFDGLTVNQVGHADALPGRTLWAFLTGLNFLVCLATVLVAYYLIRGAYEARDRAGRRALGMLWRFVLISAALGALTVMWAWWPEGLWPMAAPRGERYVPLLFQALARTAASDVPGVVGVTVWSVALSYSAAALLALTSSVILATPPAKEQQTTLELARRMRMLRTLLYFGTVVLVIVSLRVATELDWAAALYGAWNPPPAEPKDAVNHGVELVKKLFSVNTTVQAATNALILASVYVPAALVLRARAHELAKKAFKGAGTLPERERWMQDRGLALSTSEYVPRAAAILAPLLAGPIGDLIGKLAK